MHNQTTLMLLGLDRPNWLHIKDLCSNLCKLFDPLFITSLSYKPPNYYKHDFKTKQKNCWYVYLINFIM